VLFLLDPPMKLGRDETAENAALASVLANWGVTLNKDLIIATLTDDVPFNSHAKCWHTRIEHG
jgi:ABC-type uncharacterized transport system involved in gliding motility auxiliary subunit